MANFNASIATGFATNPVPTNKPDVTELHSRIRYFVSTITVPAGTAIADTITWMTLPLGARFLGHLSKMYFAAGAASSTLNLGDSVTPARYLAATAVNAAGNAVPEAANASGATFKTSLSTHLTLTSTVAGAGLLTGQVITLHGAYVID